MEQKYTKIPSNFVSSPTYYNSLILDGCSVIDYCTHNMKGVGNLFLEEHLMFFMLKGEVSLYYGKQTYTIRENEMILLKKATSIQYGNVTESDNENAYEGLMFCLNDNLIKEFLAQSDLKVVPVDEEVKTTIYPMNERLISFAHSLQSYFSNPSTVSPGLVRLKVMELLYNISESDEKIFSQILQLHKPVRVDIRQVVEQHYITPVSLPQLAFLSGRSLSAFKRDFQEIYNMPPAKWVRIKRLEKAKEMLRQTTLSVTDICYSVGFENVSHFSRIFKEHYGYPPTQNRSHYQLEICNMD